MLSISKVIMLNHMVILWERPRDPLRHMRFNSFGSPQRMLLSWSKTYKQKNKLRYSASTQTIISHSRRSWTSSKAGIETSTPASISNFQVFIKAIKAWFHQESRQEDLKLKMMDKTPILEHNFHQGNLRVSRFYRAETMTTKPPSPTSAKNKRLWITRTASHQQLSIGQCQRKDQASFKEWRGNCEQSKVWSTKMSHS